MKHFILIFTVCLLGVTSVFANNPKPIEKKTATYVLPTGVVLSGIEHADEIKIFGWAFKCKKECPGGGSISCWICRCDAMPPCASL